MSTPLNRIDLNLLRIFSVVMEERSVLRASRRVCLSQSAVSHALARLRDALGDELFVRTTSGMQPTARALRMAPLVRQAWISLESAIGLPEFDPGNAARRFSVAASDFVTMVMAPSLLGLLSREAPQVELALRPDHRRCLIEQLDLGQIDVAVGTFAAIPARCRTLQLFCYDDVLLAHRSRQFGRMSCETLATLSIATISTHGDAYETRDGCVSEQRLTLRSPMFDRAALERAFRGSRRKPRLSVSLPHVQALPSLLEDAQLAAIVPRPLALLLARTHPLSVHELPYQSAVSEVSALWSERSQGDVAQDWLCTILLRATEPLRAGPVAAERPLPDASIAPHPQLVARL
jgi:DNA-binding transcriptional LysR family regulator